MSLEAFFTIAHAVGTEVVKSVYVSYAIFIGVFV